MPIAQSIPAPTSHMLLALLLGLAAAAANILGGLFILHREWSRQYLKYFLALGAGFMLAAAILEILPESVVLTGHRAYFLVLVGYFIVHFFEHNLAPHFHFGEETHVEAFLPEHAGISALLGLSIHTFFDGVAIASGFLVSGWLGGVIFLAIVLHKDSRRLYGRLAHARQWAEPAHGADGLDLAGRRHGCGRASDGLVAFPRWAMHCRFRRASLFMLPLRT